MEPRPAARPTGPLARIVLFVGVAAAPALATPDLARSADAGHLYINPATGERLLTRTPAAPRGVTGPVWIADNLDPCGGIGVVGPFVAVVDDPASSEPDALHATYLDWGDIPGDTVIDAVALSFAVEHPDADADGDGLPEGVEGLGAAWTWYDGDNGHNICAPRTPVTTIELFNLPGDDQPADGLMARYTLTLDLGDFDDSMVTELGDTDANPQQAARFTPFSYEDLDGDGLHDFAYATRFFQPGSRDWDGDGQPDGDPAAAARAGLPVVAPDAPILPDGSLGPVAPLPAGQGMEDGFVVFIDPNNDGGMIYAGAENFGGFTCDADGSGTPGDSPDDYRPFGQFYHVLFTKRDIDCPADVFPPPDGDGVVNFFDLSYFIDRFRINDPLTDVWPPGGDGDFNFFDVSTYINEFTVGCP